MAPDDVLATVLETLKDIVGEEPPAEQPLLSAGLDSLAAVELRNTLSRCGALQDPETAAQTSPNFMSRIRFVLVFCLAPCRDVCGRAVLLCDSSCLNSLRQACHVHRSSY